MESKGSVLMQRYKLGKLLGQGTFAKVYHARNLTPWMAIDLISTGFDLYGLFEENDKKKQVGLTFRILKMKVKKKRMGATEIERIQCKKGILTIDAEIFEVTPSFYMVLKIKKCNGDTLEYQKMMPKDIKPALKDIIWDWQGDGVTTQSLEEHQVEPHPS